MSCCHFQPRYNDIFAVESRLARFCAFGISKIRHFSASLSIVVAALPPEMSRQFPRRTAKVIDSLKGPPPQTKEGGERRGRSERPSLNSPRILEIEKCLSAELNKQFVLNKVGKTCFLYTEKLKFHATTDKLHEPYNYSVELQLIVSNNVHMRELF